MAARFSLDDSDLGASRQSAIWMLRSCLRSRWWPWTVQPQLMRPGRPLQPRI